MASSTSATNSAIRELAFAKHVENPADKQFDGHMLYTVYSDGEMTLQKAGPYCWGRRTEHLTESGDAAGRRIPDGLLPRRLTHNGFEYAILEEAADAKQLHGLVRESIRAAYLASL